MFEYLQDTLASRSRFRKALMWTTKVAVVVALLSAAAQWIHDRALDKRQLAALAALRDQDDIRTGSLKDTVARRAQKEWTRQGRPTDRQ
jgi:hypothetical protein